MAGKSGDSSGNSGSASCAVLVLLGRSFIETSKKNKSGRSGKYRNFYRIPTASLLAGLKTFGDITGSGKPARLVPFLTGTNISHLDLFHHSKIPILLPCPEKGESFVQFATEVNCWQLYPGLWR